MLLRTTCPVLTSSVYMSDSDSQSPRLYAARESLLFGFMIQITVKSKIFSNRYICTMMFLNHIIRHYFSCQSFPYGSSRSLIDGLSLVMIGAVVEVAARAGSVFLLFILDFLNIVACARQVCYESRWRRKEDQEIQYIIIRSKVGLLNTSTVTKNMTLHCKWFTQVDDKRTRDTKTSFRTT